MGQSPLPATGNAACFRTKCARSLFVGHRWALLPFAQVHLPCSPQNTVQSRGANRHSTVLIVDLQNCSEEVSTNETAKGCINARFRTIDGPTPWWGLLGQIPQVITSTPLLLTQATNSSAQSWEGTMPLPISNRVKQVMELANLAGRQWRLPTLAALNVPSR